MQVNEIPRTVAHQARDAFYVAVGLGVIGVDNARSHLQRPAVDLDRLSAALDALNQRVERVTTELDERIAAVDARVDAALDQVEDGLPVPAREALANARGAAKEARAQLRNLTGRAA